MNKVILDQDLKSKLNGLNEQVELCDESGLTVGHFLPAELYKKFLSTWADAHISAEEVERRRQEPRGRTLADIWKTLGQS